MSAAKKPAPKAAPKAAPTAEAKIEQAVAANKTFEAAREYAQRAAGTALERATSLHAGAEKATAAVESAAVESVASLAKASREIQGAMFDDAKAAIAAFEKTVAAKSLDDAFRVQADYYRAQFDVNVSRAKTVGALVAQAAQESAKRAQDNIVKLGVKFDKVA
ncbi:MAG: phasin family protein [Rhodoblastus sp.]